MTTRRFDLRAWRIAQHSRRAADGAAPETAAPETAVVARSASRPLTSRQVAARLASLRCDPLAIMAKLAKNPRLDPTLRVALAHHLAAYQIEQGAARGDKALPALGDVIAAAWRKPKAAARPGAKAKSGAAKPKAATRATGKSAADKPRNAQR